MQDRPSAPELTDAVGHFLRHELAPAITDPRLRFRVLIAANLMAVITRELGAGDGPLRREWRELAALLGRGAEPPADLAALHAGYEAMRRELCARVRRGDADEGPWAEAAYAYAMGAVTARLEIANPRFLERVGAASADHSAEVRP
ncbi:MAG TPA: DUF6285 domain-containing protein [Chloroflexaceae bacterium]|nr:DUF6285 domain-containing protein [Chloroflexaceae bacterium]